MAIEFTYTSETYGISLSNNASKFIYKYLIIFNKVLFFKKNNVNMIFILNSLVSLWHIFV